jgi:secondary thiamine-phosphate synthase enzyme
MKRDYPAGSPVSALIVTAAKIHGMRKLKIRTEEHRQIVDITEQVELVLRRDYPEVSGICHLCILHTTAALTTADLDPGTDLDMLDAFEQLIPKLKYRHPHNPAHVPDHILSALVGTSVSLPVKAGELVLGTWQRVVLVELDGPRNRELTLVVTAEAAERKA